MASIKTTNLILATFAAVVLVNLSCATRSKYGHESLPAFLIGEFEDDYGVHYQIDQQVFRLLPNDKFHIKGVNKAEGFLILQNDSLNTYAPSLFTRIDYQKLKNMDPYEWAFCFSSFEEVSVEDATNKVNTQKTDLMTGCNGFPFSRMKKSGKSK
ncbi:MAG: hypothetical protein HRU41_10785 [Saprospiraceae bacterium]|nr:hypothetical protein [Saprospiraceae bacterium]